eukprot:gnl/Chilomastix_cuspidata/1581.p1 GENE.gnl/Chilomastix_cuspidata/1581~~gnl/Chilomastix_cuspidata/1581.p1  ORF type:complete len:657 (+),score=88.67 gnl/Chilomastix_cuspidata/1581:108-2078(+)
MGYYVFSNERMCFLIPLKDFNSPRFFGGHLSHVTTVRISDRGSFIGSGDENGDVLIWYPFFEQDGTGTKTERRSYFEYEVTDIGFTGDNRRFLAVGEGKTKLGEASFTDGGSLGLISGHTRKIMAADMRLQRPFRIAAASEKGNVTFHNGPPFSFVNCCTPAGKARIQALRFSPDGKFYATAAANGTVCLGSGLRGPPVGLIGRHSGESVVYDIAWAQDSVRLLSVGTDGFLRLWELDVAATEERLAALSDESWRDVPLDAPLVAHELSYVCVTHMKELVDRPVGVSWCQKGRFWNGDDIISVVTLGGDVYWFSPKPSGELALLKKQIAHQRPPRSILCFDAPDGSPRILSSASDEKNIVWAPQDPELSKRLPFSPNFAARPFDGFGKLNVSAAEHLGDGLVGVVTSEAFQLFRVVEEPELLVLQTSVKFSERVSIARGRVFGASLLVMATHGREVSLMACPLEERHVSFTPQRVVSLSGKVLCAAICVTSAGVALACGCEDSNKVHVFVFDETLQPVSEKVCSYHTSSISSLDFSPSAGRLASGDTAHKVAVWSVGPTLEVSDTPSIFGLDYLLGRVLRVSFRDYETLAMADSGSILVHDLSRGFRHRIPFKLATYGLGALGWSPRGELVYGDGAAICIAAFGAGDFATRFNAAQ